MIHGNTTARCGPCLWVFLASASFFALFANGKINSGDAAAQLESSLHLIRTRSLGARVAPGIRPSLWVRSPNGLYYEAHDLGGLIALLPAAAAGDALRQVFSLKPRGYLVVHQYCAAFGCVMISALGCVLMFRLLRNWFEELSALGLSVVFALGTIYLPYTKTCWDVLLASVLIIWVLERSSRFLVSDGPGLRDAALLGLAAGLVSLVRFSLGPTAAIGVAGVFSVARPKWRVAAVCGAVWLITLAPGLWYNAVRTGSPWLPATMAPQFADVNGFGGSAIPHAALLLVAPNRGLLAFAPIFGLAVFAPWVWSRLPRSLRVLTLAFGFAAGSYLVLIGGIRNWATFGWGPRYLVPMLPIFFLPVAGVIAILFERRKRWICGLIAVSAVLNIVPSVVDWTLASTSYPGSIDPTAWLPRQQFSAWRALSEGFAGKGISAAPASYQTGYLYPEEVGRESALFPNSWLQRIALLGRSGRIFAGVLAGSLAALCAYSTRRAVAGASALRLLA